MKLTSRLSYSADLTLFLLPQDRIKCADYYSALQKWLRFSNKLVSEVVDSQCYNNWFHRKNKRYKIYRHFKEYNKSATICRFIYGLWKFFGIAYGIASIQHCVRRNVRFEDRQRRSGLVDMNFYTINLRKCHVWP